MTAFCVQTVIPAAGKPKAGKTGGGGGEGTALIGSAGPKDSNKALDGFFARLRGGK